MQYSNCATLINERRTQQGMQFTNLFKETYYNFFMKGFSEHEFNITCGSISNYPKELFINQLYNSSLFQFNYTNTNDFFAIYYKTD